MENVRQPLSATRRARTTRSVLRDSVAVALLLAVLLSSGCSSVSMPGSRLASGSGGWNQVAQTGKGTPCVVFEAGAGDDMGTWTKVYSDVAGFTEVFAYSRQGQGLSSPKLLPRTGAETVAELRTLLKTRGIAPPYVLVGHSLGGLYMELFAKLHPNEVAGLVLVDPTHPDQLQRLKEKYPARYGLVQSMKVLGLASGLGSELMGTGATSREWHAAGPMPQRPIIVLTSTKGNALDGAEFMKFNGALQTEIVREWPGAQQRFIEASHYIQKERPADVIAAIREVLDRSRADAAHHEKSAPQPIDRSPAAPRSRPGD